MSGFIPALKIDKIPLGEGLVIKGEVVAPDARTLNAFTEAFNVFLAGWRERASKGQLKIDFSDGVAISGVTLRADKPKLKDKEYSIGIDMTNVSLDDRSKLYNLSQDNSKEIHFKIIAIPKRKSKSADDKPAAESPAAETPRKCKQCGCTEDNACQTDNGPCSWANENLDLCTACAASGQQLVDHSVDKLALPKFPANSVEERLQKALLIKDSDAAKRWAGRIKTGLSDRDLKAALQSEWDGTVYEAPDDGLHFICMSKGLSGAAFRISAKPGMKAMITSKPTLQGAQLFKKVREVLGVEEPSKGAKGARTVH